MDKTRKARRLKVLFICSGNTCRSPMAKFIMDIESRKLGIPVRTESAGLYSTQNAPINLLAKNALESMYDREFINYSKPITRELIKRADVVFTFTTEQLNDLRKLFPEYQEKILKISNEDIPDPFGGDQMMYLRTAELIKAAIIDILKRMKEM